jgi:hypothetical protein
LVGVGGWLSGSHLGFLKTMSPCVLLVWFVKETEILRKQLEEIEDRLQWISR